MKYKLINQKTNEEHLCDKVTIDGFDYYVSNEFIEEGNFAINLNTKEIRQYDGVKGMDSYWKKVIATSNPNIDIPKVVSDCMLIEKLANRLTSHLTFPEERREGIIFGYNKSQETHPNSDEDMIEFHKWAFQQVRIKESDLTTKELLQLWKEQQPKIVYYESN